MIKKELKVLLIEDNLSDKTLIVRQIKKIVANPNIVHLSNLELVKESIVSFVPDVVLSDYNLLNFTGLDVLQYLNSIKKHIPLIFITGTIHDEELAAATILTGANGFILKNNVNTLHRKLLPYFEKIIYDREKEQITEKHNAVFNNMRNYLDGLQNEDQIIRSSFNEMRRALDSIKSIEK